ncbi:hypothetical protein Q5752_006311 [Cryptotrichosporon argae]
MATITTVAPVTLKLAAASTAAPASRLGISPDIGGQANVERLHRTSRDFRSDTFTLPTDAQLVYALTASRGDDVYGEDESTAALEARIARLAGKEAAMFGMSGTMTNQLAIRTHMKQPPHSIITDHRAHVHKMEAGGIAMFSQATTHSLVPSNGAYLTRADVETNLELGDNIHIAPTRLICLENTLSGTVLPQAEIVAIGALARSHGIPMHLDGARAWEVAAKVVEERGLDATREESLQSVLTELLEPFDTASLCLSKGIGAPIGSAIVGSHEFIKRARWFRKAFGGGVRQVGAMAAAADWALTHNFPKLAGTHALAAELAHGLAELGCKILAPVETNMVFFDSAPIGISLARVNDYLLALDDPIRVMDRGRCVVHHQIDPAVVPQLVAAVAQLKAQEGHEPFPVDKVNPVRTGASKLGY